MLDSIFWVTLCPLPSTAMGRFDCANLLSSVTLFDVSTRSVMWLSAIVPAAFFSRSEDPLDGRHENSRRGVSPERVSAAEMI